MAHCFMEIIIVTFLMQFFTMVATSDLWVVVRSERRELKRLILRESADRAAKKAGVTCRRVDGERQLAYVYTSF